MTVSVIRDLGDGLILRRSSAADAEALARFNGEIHAPTGEAGPNPRISGWTRDLLGRPHPTFRPDDFLVVEDARTGAIVSSLNLISQTWSYEGIELGVGRVELVGTNPAYRQRGLVRAQMAEIHRWSAARGEQVQAITGIPYFYRQFGYEMTMTLGGGRSAASSDVPDLKDGETEPVRVRQAVEADLRFIGDLYHESGKRYPVTCLRDAAFWRYELGGRSESSGSRAQLCIIEAADGEAIGFLAHQPRLFQNRSLGVYQCELKSGASWLAVAPSILRYTQKVGQEYAAREGKGELRGCAFNLGAEHPLYEAASSRLPRVEAPYAWYLRVADLPDFLGLVAPALERRLANSIAVGHSGEVKISFYRDGLRLKLDRGRLAAIEAWKPTSPEAGDARFPGLTFLQLLFGYRTLDELRHAFPDCGTSGDDVRVILSALFPKRPSHVWPIE
ncbi:MAG: GNAT family N-acetyltransferase [Chloroflexota bacterium]